MRKKFIINLAFLLFLNLLVKPFWIFGIERSVQNIVGAYEFGFYFSLLNFSLLLNIILDLGITNFNNRNISQNNNLLSKHVSNIIGLKLVLFLIYAILSFSIASTIGYSYRQLSLLGILIFNQFLLSFILYLRSNISGLQMFKTDSMLSVLDRILMIIFSSILIWGNITETRMKIEWFVIIQTLSYAITALCAFFIVKNKTEFIRFKFNIKFFWVFLKKSFPYALLILLMSFYNRIDSVMIERLLPDGKEQAGIYAQAFRILEAASMFAYLFSILLLPMFARMIKKKENIQLLTKLSFLLIIVPAIILINICWFYRNEIMDIMYWEHSHASANILGYLMIGFAGICSTYIFGSLLTANGNLKHLNIMAVAGMILNISMNIILIPKYYVLGAAISSMTTQIFTGLTQILIANRIFKFKLDYKLIISLALFSCLSLIVCKYIYSLEYNWLILTALSVVICTGLAFITRVFKLEEIFKILLKELNQNNQ